MKTTAINIFLLFLFSIHVSKGQTESRSDYRNFPIVLSIQFHSLSMPFKDFKSNFKNMGFGIGTEVSLNGSLDWVQQFDLIWIKNKGIGNSFLFSSQAAWRPMISNGIYTEIKFGLGYMLSRHPSPSWKQKDGKWAPSEKQRKGMIALPVGIGLGYYKYSPNMFVSPFAGYQVMLLSKYNQTLPVVPQTLIQGGFRLHPNYGSSKEN
ncbi:hypothetical protein [Shivajiella indica]|uniref:Outer membrane protein beta-barrel domain-containing protein n=1 Tax=Shivajiella indica TaxID=872115 RepID=A0ABW5BBA6_9BACT